MCSKGSKTTMSQVIVLPVATAKESEGGDRGGSADLGHLKTTRTVSSYFRGKRKKYKNIGGCQRANNGTSIGPALGQH
jgi:hypothetical protein